MSLWEGHQERKDADTRERNEQHRTYLARPTGANNVDDLSRFNCRIFVTSCIHCSFVIDFYEDLINWILLLCYLFVCFVAVLILWEQVFTTWLQRRTKSRVLEEEKKWELADEKQDHVSDESCSGTHLTKYLTLWLLVAMPSVCIHSCRGIDTYLCIGMPSVRACCIYMKSLNYHPPIWLIPPQYQSSHIFCCSQGDQQNIWKWK